MKLSKQEIEDLIDRLKNGEVLPDDYKYKLFPIKQKEYELVYGGKMRREDILANGTVFSSAFTNRKDIQRQT